MQSDGTVFVEIASRDEDNILDQKYTSKNVGFLLNLIYDKRLRKG